MAIKNRTDLKSYFVKNAIPTEGNFADLIDSQLNQAPVGGDGIFKPDGEALSVVAAPGDQKRVLRLYASYPAPNPDWMISLNPAQDPATAGTSKTGFGIADGAGKLRLFIDAATGQIGVGTNTPQFALDVVGGARVQGTSGVTVTGPIVPSVGNSETNGIQFPKDPGLGGGDRAFIRYFVESGETTKLLIGNNNDADDRISLYQMSAERLTVYNGCVGINNITPGATLDVSATSTTWGGWLEAIRLSRPEHSAITHPGGKLQFGMHSDRNFYFSDTNGNRHVMTISGATANVSIIGGLIFEGAVGHIDRDGALYRNTDGQCYLTVDDNLYIRDSGSGVNWAAHFDTNAGNLELKGRVISTVKNFQIDHPLDPTRSLVHSVIEGPEAAVLYRGQAILVDGKCEIELPSYFEALTRKENRTVLITPKLSEGEETSALAAGDVADGKFLVRAIDPRNCKQRFYWEVKAVRADIDPIEVEPMKTERSASPAPGTTPRNP